jgi:Class II Aldolase and Adducin N-terminal domain
MHSLAQRENAAFKIKKRKFNAQMWEARIMKSTLLAIVMLLGIVGAASAEEKADADAVLKRDIVTAFKILVNEGILDSFGHVSARSTKNPNIFLIPLAMPPALVTEDDILEVCVADSQPVDPKGRRVNGERYIHGESTRPAPM